MVSILDPASRPWFCPVRMGLAGQLRPPLQERAGLDLQCCPSSHQLSLPFLPTLERWPCVPLNWTRRGLTGGRRRTAALSRVVPVHPRAAGRGCRSMRPAARGSRLFLSNVWGSLPNVREELPSLRAQLARPGTCHGGTRGGQRPLDAEHGGTSAA